MKQENYMLQNQSYVSKITNNLKNLFLFFVFLELQTDCILIDVWYLL